MIFLLLVGFALAEPPKEVKASTKSKCPVNVTVSDPVAFLISWNREAALQRNKVVNATWNFMTNMTEWNHQQQLEMSKAFKDWEKKATACGKTAFKRQLDQCTTSVLKSGCFLKDELKCLVCGPGKGRQAWSVQRQKRALSKIFNPSFPTFYKEEQHAEYYRLLNRMTKMYSTTEVPELGSNCKKWHRLDPFVIDKFANLTSDPKNGVKHFNELKFYWEAWHDRVGEEIFKLYPEFIGHSNKAARKHGKRDTGQIWRSRYGPNTRKEVDKLWSNIKPLYQLMHGYVRYRLNSVYGDDYVREGAFPIPSHLLGNVWAQTWENILPQVAPYPNEELPLHSQTLKDKNVTDIFKDAERFFTSVGLLPMTKEFWNKETGGF